MAQLPPVKSFPGEWVDIYLETGIAVGTQVIIQNKGDAPAFLADSAAEPPIPFDITTVGANELEPKLFYTTNGTPDGAWVYSDLGTTLQVEVAA